MDQSHVSVRLKEMAQCGVSAFRRTNPYDLSHLESTPAVGLRKILLEDARQMKIAIETSLAKVFDEHEFVNYMVTGAETFDAPLAYKKFFPTVHPDGLVHTTNIKDSNDANTRRLMNTQDMILYLAPYALCVTLVPATVDDKELAATVLGIAKVEAAMIGYHNERDRRTRADIEQTRSQHLTHKMYFTPHKTDLTFANFSHRCVRNKGYSDNADATIVKETIARVENYVRASTGQIKDILRELFFQKIRATLTKIGRELPPSKLHELFKMFWTTVVGLVKDGESREGYVAVGGRHFPRYKLYGLQARRKCKKHPREIVDPTFYFLMDLTLEINSIPGYFGAGSGLMAFKRDDMEFWFHLARLDPKLFPYIFIVSQHNHGQIRPVPVPMRFKLWPALQSDYMRYEFAIDHKPHLECYDLFGQTLHLQFNDFMTSKSGGLYVFGKIFYRWQKYDNNAIPKMFNFLMTSLPESDYVKKKDIHLCLEALVTAYRQLQQISENNLRMAYCLRTVLAELERKQCVKNPFDLEFAIGDTIALKSEAAMKEHFAIVKRDPQLWNRLSPSPGGRSSAFFNSFKITPSEAYDQLIRANKEYVKKYKNHHKPMEVDFV